MRMVIIMLMKYKSNTESKILHFFCRCAVYKQSQIWNLDIYKYTIGCWQVAYYSVAYFKKIRGFVDIYYLKLISKSQSGFYYYQMVYFKPRMNKKITKYMKII